jgi:DNA-binding response OmpR family regulator
LTRRKSAFLQALNRSMNIAKVFQVGDVMNKILIVDNDKSIQMLYADELAEDGYDVITSGDGSEVMKLIKKENPDVIVMDIKLGKDSGLDLLQEIRNTHYNLPVILCTAYPTFKYDLKSIAADYYVTKSSDLTKLKLKINMALEGVRELPSSSTLKKGKRPEPMSMEQTRLNWTGRSDTE